MLRTGLPNNCRRIHTSPLVIALQFGELLSPLIGFPSQSFTIRGDFGLSRQMNIVHGSDGPEAAAREIPIYFRPEELVSYSTSLDPWTCAGDEK